MLPAICIKGRGLACGCDGSRALLLSGIVAAYVVIDRSLLPSPSSSLRKVVIKQPRWHCSLPPSVVIKLYLQSPKLMVLLEVRSAYEEHGTEISNAGNVSHCYSLFYDVLKKVDGK
ncbi:hypothetical protein U9M48_003671 [Paspalum notatum var. saurae]|uniref:Uncharacterized protein n=1 Tax=Paspalum notatum var. saurae TaxID=547442 RepID=A0AAQ3PNE4_PASNO